MRILGDKYNNVLKLIKYIYINNKKYIFISAIVLVIVTVIDIYVPMLIKTILDTGISGKNMNALCMYIIIYAVIRLLGLLLNMLASFMFSLMRNGIVAKLRIRALRHLSNLSGKYYTNKKTGDILSIIQSDIDNIESIDTELIFSIIKNVLTALFSLYFMMTIQSELFAFVIFLQVLLLVVQRKFSDSIHNNISIIRKEYGNITHMVQEYISNIISIVITKSRNFFLSGYIDKNRIMIGKSIYMDVLFSGNRTVASLINLLVDLVVYGYGGYRIIKGDLTIGSMIAFQSYSGMLIGPCMSIINANNTLQRAIVSVDRYYGLLDQETDIKPNTGDKLLDKKSIKKIEFKDVSFSYDEKSDKNVLDSVDLSLFKGNTYAIVGSSGSGKSTIINLLYRVWDVSSGGIYIDGVDLRDINVKSLRKNISIVTQDCMIFDTSIKDNICLGRKVSDELLNQICDKVGLKDYISSLDKGWDTNIGEKGIKLSGGQRQRISIARVLLSDTDVVVFDEATSALDNISQNNIIHNLKDFFGEKIVLMIAHRLSTIVDVDKIFVLSNGRIVEEGNHKELLKQQGAYEQFYLNSKFEL